MPRKNNRTYKAKVWSSNGSGIDIKIKVGSSTSGYRLELVEALKEDADTKEKQWYITNIEPLKNDRRRV